MVAIKSLIIFATSVSALAIERRGTPVVKRQASVVQADLNAINSDTVALDNSINSWDGTQSGALAIANAEGVLDKKIQSSTTDAKNAGKFTAAQGTSIENYISNTLIPNVKKALTDLDNNHARVEAINFQGVVESDLQSLKSDTDSFAQALIADAPTQAEVTTGQNEQNTLDGYFNTAINTYSS